MARRDPQTLEQLLPRVLARLAGNPGKRPLNAGEPRPVGHNAA